MVRLVMVPLFTAWCLVTPCMWAVAEVDPATGQPAIPAATHDAGAAAEKGSAAQTPRQPPAHTLDDRVGSNPVSNSMPRLLAAPPAIPPPPTPSLTSQDPLILYREWLLRSDTMEQAHQQQKWLAGFGLKIKRRQWLPQLGFVLSVYQLPLDADPQALRRQIEQQYPQLKIEYNQRYPLLSDTPDPAKTFGLQITGAPQTGCPRFTGSIAMMDAGVRADHPSLKGRVQRLDVAGASSQQQSRDSGTDHGTAVASLLLALLPESQLLAVNVYQRVDNGMETRSDWLLAGFEAVLAHNSRPAVLNMSFGGYASDLMAEAMERLSEQGIRLVAAAGNGGRQAGAVYPAAYPPVKAVSAVDAKERIWSGSSRGEYISYAAPGVDLWLAKADGTGYFASGTSFAAPWVSAAAALASDAQWAKPASLARDLGKPGRDSDYGYGLIQLGILCH